jgi:formate dehydrogenase iron-sulfur subunit
VHFHTRPSSFPWIAGSSGGFGAFFLLLDDPEVYGLPPDPVVTTKHLGEMWRTMATAAAVVAVGIAAAFLGGRS